MNKTKHADEVLLTGVSAAPGIAMAKAGMYKHRPPAVSVRAINEEEVSHHIDQFEEALAMAEKELNSLLEGQHNEDATELLQAQIAMINDPDLRERVEAEIKKNKEPADAAIHKVFQTYLKLMGKHQEGGLQERSIDIADARDRLIQIFHHDEQKKIKQGAIVVAQELSPREVIEFFERDVQGIIMEKGGRTSHAAILARAMQIPTVVGLENAATAINTGNSLILDGNRGEVVVSPSPQTRQKYDAMQSQRVGESLDYEKISQKHSQTVDEQPFILRANIGFEEELSSLQIYGAEGVGLLRTESIYLNRSRLGSEQSQRAFYKTVLESTKPNPVTIRLFDAGGDKLFNLGQQEQNPFLGWRGIRMLLDEEKLLNQQLCAIAKTAALYPERIRILVPMVSSLEEVSAVKEALQHVQNQLQAEGEKIDLDLPLGLMVEVPNVAMQIQHFAQEVDFLSIGTNDLTQYVLAVDRGNERISGLYNQLHPALWKLIEQVVEGARVTGTPVSVCGELASNPVGACGLLGLGIQELSMAPPALPEVKKMLCNRRLDDMQRLAKAILECTTVAEVEHIITEF